MVSPEVIRTAVGILGNAIALGLFLSPVPTFMRIRKKGSVEEFSPFPYLATLLNCMMWVLYGLPMVHPHSTLVITINGSGVIIELSFVLLFLLYSQGRKRFLVLAMLLAEITFVGIVTLLVVTLAHTYERRSLIVGVVCVFLCAMMYASPLSAMIPNALGVIFAAAQLILHVVYRKSTKEQLEAKKKSAAAGFLKLRYALEENYLSCSPENLTSSKMLDKSNANMDDMEDFERQIQDFFIEVRTKLEMGNKEDAIDLLQANYEVVKEQIDDGAKGVEQAAILDVIALGYMGVGNLKFVEHLLDMLNDIVGALHDVNPLVDSILIHMGSMFTTLGKFEDAILVYQRGLKILEREFGGGAGEGAVAAGVVDKGNNSPFLVTPLMGMAKVIRSIGRVTKAITIYHQAVDILEKNRGAKSEELVIPLFALGNLFISEGKATDAETCFSRTLNFTGSVQEAIHTYKRGLQVVRDSEFMKLDDDVLEKMMIDLAELLHVTGREQEGRELLEECLLIAERYKGIEHPSSVTHLLNLATSHSHSKNFVEAERLLRTCLHIMSKTVGPNDHSVTVPMLHLAVAIYHLKRDEEAESLAMEVLHIRENAYGKESLLVGEALDCLVSIQTRLGKDDSDILAKLKRILSIQEKEMGYESEEVMTTLKKVVYYLDKMGKKEEKLPLQRRLTLLRTKYKHKIAKLWILEYWIWPLRVARVT
ncbi:putative Bidirectional sugar transporter SWEET4 [Cocos nucifera]|uniref:Putative Bidirectional sugar transporter SWEET4 n=1 Tax=Cocos nucifera TaxID=13894 RepID=A0A8K0I382_COCNU|nr:putative Bidirectional sugar transporter SWEET4 [Cocos nucifera]